MTELLLVCALGALGIAFAVALGRWLHRRPNAEERVADVAWLVGEGARRFLVRQSIISVVAAAVLAALIFLAYGVVYQLGWASAMAPRELGVCASSSLLLGAAGTLIVVWSGWWATRSSAARVVAATRQSLDESLQLALRGGAVAAMVALSLVALGVGGLFALLYAYAGGLSAATAQPFSPVTELPLLMAGFALGASCVALFCQIGGGGFHAVADMIRDLPPRSGSSTPLGDADRIELLVDMVGDSIGDGAVRGAGVFSCAVLVSWAGMWAAALLHRANPGLPSAMAWVLYPIVIQAFALLAAWFGILVVRTDDTEVPTHALARGLYVSQLLCAVAAVGSAKWLLATHWLRFGGCAVAGVLGSLVIFFWTQYYTEHRHAPVRAMAETARGGATLVLLRGLVASLEGAAVLLTASALVMWAAWWLGGSTGLHGGHLLGVAVATGAMFGVAPSALAMNNMAAIVDVSGGLIELNGSAERPDVQARARLLDNVGATAKAYGKSLSQIVGAGACLVLVGVLASAVGARTGGHGSLQIDPGTVLVQAGVVMGVLTAMVFAWVMLRHIVAATREVMADMRARGVSATASALQPAIGGALEGVGAVAGDGARGSVDVPADAALPAGWSPRAKPLADELLAIESVARLALRGVLLPAGAGIALPIIGCLALRIVASGDRVPAAAASMVALLIAATIVGVLGALLLLIAGNAWDNAKKYIETGAHGGPTLHVHDGEARKPNPEPHPELGGEMANPTYFAAVVGDALGDPLRNALAPATQVLLQTLVALVLVFLPLFL